MRDHDQILDAVHYEETLGKMTWRDMFIVYKRRSWIAILVQTCVQLQGINVIPVSKIFMQTSRLPYSYHYMLVLCTYNL